MVFLKDYFALQQLIFDYFEYKEDWVSIPLDDSTDEYWMLGENGPGWYCTSPTPFTTESVQLGSDIYGGIIYRQRFLPKHVYRAADYTMAVVDTQTDGNKYLMVFDNKKECTDPELKALYYDIWGAV